MTTSMRCLSSSTMMSSSAFSCSTRRMMTASSALYNATFIGAMSAATIVTGMAGNPQRLDYTLTRRHCLLRSVRSSFYTSAPGSRASCCIMAPTSFSECAFEPRRFAHQTPDTNVPFEGHWDGNANSPRQRHRTPQHEQSSRKSWCVWRYFCQKRGNSCRTCGQNIHLRV